MGDSRVIAVMGATGAQGGGLVRAICADPGAGFAARAITRDAGSEKAQALRRLGAEVVEADLDDPASVRAAFDGAYGAYCVTFFWNHFSPEKENEHARTMAAAAKEAGLRHVIWSTLEDTRRWVPLSDDRMPTLGGSYKVPHFDAKGEVDAVFTDLGLPVTLLRTSFYWDNLIYFGMGPQRGEDGTLAITLPMGDKRLPGICAEDIGRCAYGIFQAGDAYVGEAVAISGENLTGAEMASALGEFVGEEVRYNDVPPEVYRSFGFPGAEDLGNMFQFKRDFEAAYCGARDPAFARTLNPSLHTFKGWLTENGSRIPIE